VDDLQAAVARAADQAGSHSTAPALLLQAATALGRLAELANTATEGGRRPFRIPPNWEPELTQLGYLVYLLADQTAVDIDVTIRALAGRVSDAAVHPQAQAVDRRDSSWLS
jgi:hypothetical protein